MEDDKPEYLGFFSKWIKPVHESKKKAQAQEEEEEELADRTDELAVRMEQDEIRRKLKLSISQSMFMFNSTPPTPNGYIYGADAISEEVRPEPIDMTQYIHKDEMVQILLDSRHAMFNDRIPSVLEVLEWIDQRERKK